MILIWCWKQLTKPKAHARQTVSAGEKGKETEAVATFTTSVSNQHFIALRMLWCQSSALTAHFFIVCTHRHGMMELQLMARNEFLLCLFKTEQNRKIPVTGNSHPRGARARPAAPPSPSVWVGDRVNCTGPRMPLNTSLILRIKKQNQLANTSQVSTGCTINQKVATLQTLTAHVLCTLGNGAQLECGEERKYIYIFTIKKLLIYIILGVQNPGVGYGVMGRGGVRAVRGAGWRPLVPRETQLAAQALGTRGMMGPHSWQCICLIQGTMSRKYAFPWKKICNKLRLHFGTL